MTIEATFQPTPSRRALLAAAGGLSVVTGSAAAIGATHPDAELIQACARHADLMNAANSVECLDEDVSDTPEWAAYEANFVFIDEAEPQTLEGILAKARAARAEGDECEMGGRWAWNVVDALLRLHGEA